MKPQNSDGSGDTPDVVLITHQRCDNDNLSTVEETAARLGGVARECGQRFGHQVDVAIFVEDPYYGILPQVEQWSPGTWADCWRRFFTLQSAAAAAGGQHVGILHAAVLIPLALRLLRQYDSATIERYVKGNSPSCLYDGPKWVMALTQLGVPDETVFVRVDADVEICAGAVDALLEARTRAPAERIDTVLAADPGALS